MKTKLLLTASLLVLVINVAFTQPGSLDRSFNKNDLGFNYGDQADNAIFTSAVQSDGKIIIGGDFTAYNGTSRNHIARLNADGSLDNSFNPGTGAYFTIRAISIQSDGKIIIGGDFTTYNGVSRNHIARINANGSLDYTFSPGTGANAIVRTISIQTDGKIVITGDFTAFNGWTRNYITRLNTDGSLDFSFIPGNGATNYIPASAIQNDGKIIIGGDFTSYNGTSRNRIARLKSTGSIDSTFNPGSGANGTVETVVVQNDGKIIIGGKFTTYNGTSSDHVARLNTDGSLDLTFNSGLASIVHVYSTALQSDGKLLIGWNCFMSSENYYRVNRLNTNGTVDNTFKTGNTDYFIQNINIQSVGKILVTGSFIYYADKNVNFNSTNYITRLNDDGSLDGTFNPQTGANNSVYTTTFQSDKNIIIGGKFSYYNDSVSYGITRVNYIGKPDGTFGRTGSDVLNSVFSSAVQNDGKIILGGKYFFDSKSKKIFGIARFNSNGKMDETFNHGNGAISNVYSISIDTTGKIIVGGDFTSFNSTTKNRIIRLNNDGTLDNTFNPGTGANRCIYSTAIQKDGKIIIAGEFISFNGVTINRIARLNSDGSRDNTFNPGTGVNNTIYSIAIQNDGKIIIGGNFSSVNGISKTHLARFNSDGSLDNTFNLGYGPNYLVYSVAIQNDGKIIIGGNFTQYNGTVRNYIAKLNSDGTLDNIFDPGAGANNAIRTVMIQSDAKIVIGGDFTSYNGTGRNRVARILNCPATGTDTINACKSYTWIDGKTYTSNNYNATFNISGGGAGGCDSIVTLNLTITNPDTSVINSGISLTSKATGAKYQWLNCNNNYAILPGETLQTFTPVVNGNYSVSVTKNNCIDTSACYKVKCPATGTHTVSACKSYTWIDGKTYTSNNNTANYNIVGGAANGCDSLVTLNLTIYNTDASVTLSGKLLTAKTTGATYQWLDCDKSYAVIPGETLRTFTPVLTGNYAVSVTENNCTDTSTCNKVNINGINENNSNYEISLYPNPIITKAVLQSNFQLNNATLTLCNTFGQTVMEIKNINGKELPIQRNSLLPGIYFMRLAESDKLLATKKIIITD